jgi:hypothetical protein
MLKDFWPAIMATLLYLASTFPSDVVLAQEPGRGIDVENMDLGVSPG